MPPITERYSGHRVGYYFESLIDHWLRCREGLEMLASGLQVREGGRTLGELDFVFRDCQGRVCHWEVAVKFYLYCADRQVAGSQWIGPDPGDTFERKWERIQHQQLPLCRQVFPQVDECSCFVKGRIFYHPEQPVPGSLPEGLMPDHLRGIWLRDTELAWVETASREHGWGFRILRKPFWLADLCLADTDLPPVRFEELNALLGRHFLAAGHPVMISALQRRDGCWEEGTRLIVVPDSWPGG